MSDILSTGLSGLLAFRRALDTTSHNIANVNTEGYSRQIVDFSTRNPTPEGSGWVGNGVQIDSIRRLYSDYLVTQARGTGGNFERLKSYAAQAERVNNLFSDSETGLAATIQKFTNAVQAVAASPTSIAARQVFLGEANATVLQLQGFDNRLRDFASEANGNVVTEVNQIAALAQGIATLNKQITQGLANNNQQPNDLLDQRDRLLDQLSAKVNISVVPQDAGVINVFVGKGQSLVLGYTAAKLGTQPDSFDPSQTKIVLQNDLGSVDVTSSLNGGSLGGLLDFRKEILDPARSTLGRISAGLAQTFNDQHVKGIDLRGALGGQFFSVSDPTILANSGNSGSAGVAVTRTDTGALTGADYRLNYDGSSWLLVRSDTGAVVPLSGAGTVASPFRADGLSIVVSGAAAVGDRFAVLPTREATASLTVRVLDPGSIAVAAPIRASAVLTNTGTGSVTPGEVLDATHPQLRSSVAIQFTSANTYSINGSGSFAYTAGAPINLNGWRVTLSGQPAVGDRFDVVDNRTGTGDNRNGQALADALKKPLFDAGTVSLTDSIAQYVSAIGVSTNQAQINRDAQGVLNTEALTQKSNVSGVNLDEEAAALVRYQQAYQAASEVIRIANSLFDTLLNAVRR